MNATPSFNWFSIRLKHPLRSIELYITVGQEPSLCQPGPSQHERSGRESSSAIPGRRRLVGEYNHTLAHGKWNHMMDQTRIGYTGWHDPPAKRHARG